MKLSVRSIQSERGAKVHSEFHENVPNLGSDAELTVRGPAHVQVTATNLGGRIGLEGRLHLPVRLVCSRCMREYDLDLDEPIEDFFVKGHGRNAGARHQSGADDERVDGDAGAAFAEEDGDEREYDGDVIELDDVVRDTALLAVPMKPVCEEACRGLCPICGHNLNEGDCGCDQDDVDPRLAGLARWFDTDLGPARN